MLARRSESCPRLARKEPLPQAQRSPQPLVPSSRPPSRSCTLQDLGPEDRQKVAKLLKQVVDLGQEVQQLKLQRDELTQQAQTSSQREQALQEDSQQLQKEHHSLKKKLAQALLVLRATQAKVTALEAAQQQIARSPQCTAAVQTEPVSIIDLDARSSTASNTYACGAGRCAAPPAPPAPTAATQPPTGNMESVSCIADSAAVRTSLANTTSGPPFLHVAPGAHVNITINHVPDPTTAAAAPTPAAQVAMVNVGVLDSCEAEFTPAASPTCPQGGCNEWAGTSTAAASQDGSVFTASPTASPAVIAIPTTTTAAASASVAVAAARAVAAGLRAEAAVPEVSTGSCAVAGSCTRAMGNTSMPDWAVQQAVPMREAHDYVAPGAVPKAVRPTAASLGQPTCGKPAGPRNILVDATMHRFEAVPVHEVRVHSREVLTASPMIVPPCDEVVAAASRLLGWQIQHGFTATGKGPAAATTSSANAKDPRSGRKVLSYDPAIGQSGAFYFVDVADVAQEPALGLGSSVSGPTQAGRPGPGAVAGSWHPPSPTRDTAVAAAGASITATERAGGTGPQLAPQRSLFNGEATLRQWSNVDEPRGLGRLAGGGSTVAVQHPEPYLHNRQHPTLVSERPVLASPCSSYTTETTNTGTPFMHGEQTPAVLPGYKDTPASSSMSLSQIAVALDEVARRQRWDVQPPCGRTQYNEGGSAPGHLPRAGLAVGHGPSMRLCTLAHGDLGGAAGPLAAGSGPGHGGRKHREPHSAQGPPAQQLLRYGSAVSATASTAVMAAAAAAAAVASSPRHAGHEAAQAQQMDDPPTCGSTSILFGGNDVADRYDDSLVDILSQADEELEYQQQHWQRQRTRPQPQRPSSQPSAGRPGTAIAARARAVATTAAGPLPEAALTRAKLQAASTEALLAANLYEENDVLSVILEQEG